MVNNNIIEKAGDFAKEFVEKITNNDWEFSRRQTYFLDTQEDLKKYMKLLKNAIDSIEGFDGNEMDSDMESLLEEAKDTQKKIMTAVMDFQEEMKINPDTASDEVPSLNKDNIQKAKETGSLLKDADDEIMAIKNDNTGWFNYALICDGQVNLLDCSTDKELNVAMNNIVDSKDYKDIHLFRIKATEVPLKKKTILTI